MHGWQGNSYVDISPFTYHGTRLFTPFFTYPHMKNCGLRHFLVWGYLNIQTLSVKTSHNRYTGIKFNIVHQIVRDIHRVIMVFWLIYRQ